jgi:hypothetical protein
MIVIIGENLQETRRIWFNNKEAEFNPNYRTSTSVIVTIPDDIPLKGTDPTAPNQIKLETPYGIAYYEFSFYSPEPIIDLLIFEIPAVEGADLTVTGSNFYEVQEIVFLSETGYVATTEFTVSSDYKSISLKFPEGSINAEAIIAVVCVSGTVEKEFSPAPMPVVRSVSSDMPIVGDNVIISGEYFYGVEKIILPNNVEVTQFDINDTRSEIIFKMPTQTPTQGGKLTVVIRGENYDVPGIFYPYEWVMVDSDGKGGYSWGDQSRVIMATSDQAPYTSTGNCGNVYGLSDNFWWGGNIIWWFNEYPTAIPDNTPVDRIFFKFSFYTEHPLNEGFFQVQFGERWDLPARVPEFKPYLDANEVEVGSKPGRWIDYEIPVSAFGTDLQTYRDIRILGTKDVGFYFKNSSQNASLRLNVFIDNIRFVVK